MNVQLAAQLLSNSVADALDICRTRLKLPQFVESEGTSKFLRIFNNAFDILNSRNLSHTGSAYKKLITYVQLEEVPDGSNCLGNLEEVL
uniref:Transposable element P transposase-like GTP-binding insertion domain-containing protein n=1 Tax=Phlebotomus papatasi TaxID=29031 RepID=A0A1B0D956_PHLPP